MLKRVAAMNDLSGLGHCSLTIDLPVLSAMGIQCCPIPTTVLSSQTDGYEGYSLCDLTDELSSYVNHWAGMGEKFDGIMTGYLASSRQVSIVHKIIDTLSDEDTKILIDPVMGDNGALYPSVDERLCEDIRSIVSRAHVITPNLTEAAILLGRELKANDEGEWSDWAKQLLTLGAKSAVITGVDAGNGKLCTVSCTQDGCMLYYTKKTGCSYPGTGDMFAAVTMGELVLGKGLHSAANKASDFAGKCVEYTYKQNPPRREGLIFEPMLGELICRE